MISKSLLLAGMILTICACDKPTRYSGTVFSKHHVPVAGLKVSFPYGETATSSQDGEYSTTTDASGHFVLTQNDSRKHRVQEINIQSDSGSFHAQITGTTWNNDDIELNN